MLASLESMGHRVKTKRSEPARPEAHLRELEGAGELIAKSRSYFGTLPEIKLIKKTRLDRIIKVTER